MCYDGVDESEQNSLVNFTWQSSSDTDSYDLIIVNQETNISQTESGISTTSKELSLTKQVSYSWRVVYRSNDSSVITSSDTWQFYLPGNGEENHVPFPATIVSPRLGSTITSSNTVVLVWEGNDPDINDVLTYTVYIDSIDGLQDQTNSDYIGISDSTVDVNVESGMTYYWRIKTSDGVSSSFTQVYSFRVD